LKADAKKVIDGQAVARDRTRLAYSLYENGNKGRRVALIHSIGMDRNFWRPAAQQLAQDASVLIYDCRGHGASDKPAGPYSVALFADDLADLLDHVGWDGAAVGGASMGGCVALAFAAAYPTRTQALGLIDTTAWYGPEALKQWAERADKAARDGLGSLVEFQTTRWFGDKFRAENPQIVERCVETFLANDVPAYGESCRMLGTADMRAALLKLNMPTAIVVGEEDYATPLAMAETLHRGIKGSTLTVLPGARHLTPLEQPDRIARQLRQLMAAGQ
jgi:3-oxoadipate enol-lactonase